MRSADLTMPMRAAQGEIAVVGLDRLAEGVERLAEAGFVEQQRAELELEFRVVDVRAALQRREQSRTGKGVTTRRRRAGIKTSVPGILHPRSPDDTETARSPANRPAQAAR